MLRKCVLTNLRFVSVVFCQRYSSLAYKNRKLLSLERLSQSIVFVSRKAMNLTAVISEFENLAPLNLAETWDNVGLLLDQSTDKSISTILFTNDLTEKVLDEAVQLNADLIYSYHPPIFASFKYLRKSEWKHRIILTCIEKGIAIYSPHTALDACEGGVNDWLISCFDTLHVNPLKHSNGGVVNYIHEVHCIMPFNFDISEVKSLPGISVQPVSSVPPIKYINFFAEDAHLESLVEWLSKVKLTPISVSKREQPLTQICGVGRIAGLKSKRSLKEMISLVKQHVNLNSLRVAVGQYHQLESLVTTVAVCAGSGASVLRGTTAELLVTGEMSHHELLDAQHNGKTVILCEHSNSERGYLTTLVKKMSPKLPNIKLCISKMDADPVVII